MFNNQQFYPNGTPMPNYGTVYGQAQAPVRATQTLTQEEINQLTKKAGLDLAVTQEDILKSKCVHRDMNGETVLTRTDDGKTYCPICKESFHLVDISQIDKLKDAVTTLNDFGQSIKTLGVTIPSETITQYFVILPMVKKITDFFEYAVNDFNRYDVSYHNPTQMVNQQAYGFNMLNNIMAGGYNMYGQPQPMYGQPPMQQQPTYGGQQMQQPVQQPNMQMGAQPQQMQPPMQQPVQQQMQQPMVENPFVMANSQPMYGQPQQQPMYNMYGQPIQQPMPGQVQQPVQQPVAPAQAPVDTTVTEGVATIGNKKK